jgi:hypothetical protein
MKDQFVRVLSKALESVTGDSEISSVRMKTYRNSDNGSRHVSAIINLKRQIFVTSEDDKVAQRAY